MTLKTNVKCRNLAKELVKLGNELFSYADESSVLQRTVKRYLNSSRIKDEDNARS